MNKINLHKFYLLNDYTAPVSYYPELEEKDYEDGIFTRYFVKKRNDETAKIIEVDENQSPIITYENIDTGEIKQMRFDLVVLATCIIPSLSNEKIAKPCGKSQPCDCD